MSTALDIVTRALRRLNVITPEETPDSSEAQTAIDTLNDLIGAWPAEGLTISESDFPLDQRYNQGLVALLAIRLADTYGKTPGPSLMRDAKHGWQSLQADFGNSNFVNMPDAVLDDAGVLTTGRGLFTLGIVDTTAITST